MKLLWLVFYCTAQIYLCSAIDLIPKFQKDAVTTGAFDEIRNTQARARELAGERETITNSFRQMAMDTINEQTGEIVENMIATHQELRYIYLYIKDFGTQHETNTCINDLLFENEYIAYIFELEFSECNRNFDVEFQNATQTYNDMLEMSIRRTTIAMQALTITEISQASGFIREPVNALNYFNERLYRYIGDWNTYYSILLQSGHNQMAEKIHESGENIAQCMAEVVESMTMYGNDIMYRMIYC